MFVADAKESIDEKSETNNVEYKKIEINSLPSSPSLTYPTDGVNNIPITPTFRWTDRDDPNGGDVTYTLEYNEKGQVKTETDANGQFQFDNIRFGYGYNLKIYASGYSMTEINNIS